MSSRRVVGTPPIAFAPGCFAHPTHFVLRIDHQRNTAASAGSRERWRRTAASVPGFRNPQYSLWLNQYDSTCCERAATLVLLSPHDLSARHVSAAGLPHDSHIALMFGTRASGRTGRNDFTALGFRQRCASGASAGPCLTDWPAKGIRP
jgi:hypothetical protein